MYVSLIIVMIFPKYTLYGEYIKVQSSKESKNGVLNIGAYIFSTKK